MRRTVTRFESNLLRILHSLLTQADQNRAVRLLEQSSRWPKSLHRDSVELVQDSLAKGSVSWLVQQGAWKQQRHLRDGQASRGSLWERTPPEALGLHFSDASLDFLIWMTATDVFDSRTVWSPRDRKFRLSETPLSQKPLSQTPKKGKTSSKHRASDRLGETATRAEKASLDGPESVSTEPIHTHAGGDDIETETGENFGVDLDLKSGDELLLFLATRLLRGTPVLDHWLASEAMIHHPLLALAMPDQFARVGVMPEPCFDSWMVGSRSLLIEALQEEFARSWVAMEKEKSKIRSMDEMARLGKVQRGVLTSMMESCKRHNRRDLCRFVVDALAGVAVPTGQREDWIGSLDTKGKRLAERTAVYEHASALLRVHVGLQQWQKETAGVSFFDEGYAESQLWKTVWEDGRAESAVAEAKRLVAELQ